MTAAWPKVRLGELLYHRKEFITIDDLITYKRPRVQLHAQGIVLRDNVPGALIKTKAQQVCRAGEFLVAEIDAKVGGFGIVSEALAGSIVSSHYFLFVLNESKLDRRFLDYFIRTPSFRDQVEAQGSTNYAAIRPADVLGYKIPLPPLAEQQRIVARIEELAAQIAEAKALRKQAAEEVEALVPSAMCQRFNFDKAQTTVGDFAKVQGGFAFVSSSYVENGTHQVVRIGNVRDGYLDLGRAPVRWNPAGDTRILKHELKPGDLVISMTGTREKRDYGFIAKVPEKSQLLLNQRVGRFVIHREVDRDYLFQFLRSPFFRDRLFPSATGTANQANIGNGDIEQIRFAPPSLPEQRRIVAKLDALQAEVDKLRRLQAETERELQELVPSILDKAFKGEL